MITQFYSPLEGQLLLVVDAILILLILVSENIPMKKPFWYYSMFSLCWSVIVVATAVVQRIR